MNANVAWRMPAWRNFVWVGMAASIVAWAWAWFVGDGSQVLMVIVALTTVPLAYKAVSGMRVALVGLMIAGLVMFLYSVYEMFSVMIPSARSTPFDLASATLFPMVAAVILLLGAVSGFRHARG
jgi:hypothetical protein